MDGATRQKTQETCPESAIEMETAEWQMLVHDLRAPLVGVQKVIELAIEDRSEEQGTDSRAFGMLQSAQANIEMVLDMLTDVMDLGRIRMGEFFVVKQPIDIRPLIGRCIEVLRSHAAEKNLTFQTYYDGDLPKVLADERRLVRILVNVLHNALKYSPRGRQVDVRCKVEKDTHVLVSATDLGEGIGSDDASKVFLKGYRCKTPGNACEQGYGWGLYYCKLAVTSLGGRIWVESPDSSEDFGLRVCFTIPLAD